MKIEPGMKFRGNVNGCEILVLRADSHNVIYRDLKSGYLFTVGRSLFENCDIQEQEARA